MNIPSHLSDRALRMGRSLLSLIGLVFAIWEIFLLGRILWSQWRRK